MQPFMRFRWAQCFCPENHSVFSFVLNNLTIPDSRVETLLRAAVKAMLLGRGDEIGSEVSRLDPWCALCGAPPETWHYKTTLTGDYPSWDAAREAMTAWETAQQELQREMDRRGLSFKTRRKPRGNGDVS